METTVKQRITEFIKLKKISVREFERVCGLSYGYINNIRVSIQPDKLSNIARYYPELNTGWIATGEGTMLKRDISALYEKHFESFPAEQRLNDKEAECKSTPTEKMSTMEEKLLGIIESQQRVIEQLTLTVSQKKTDANMVVGVAGAG